MHPAIFRLRIVVLVVTGLAACTGQPVTPASQTHGSDTRPGVTTRFDASPPCKIEGIWYFMGPCRRVRMKPAGIAVSFAQYKGLTLTLAFPKNTSSNSRFIVGEGTSTKDIIGSVDGDKFVDYDGGLPCYSSKAINGLPVQCPPGKGILYTVIYNDTHTTITFQTIPAITIRSTGTFPPSKECQIIGMFGALPTAWIVYPSHARLKNGVLTLPGKGTFLVPGKARGFQGSFQVIGVVCT